MEELREKLHAKEAEFAEKYANVIYDLGVKYNTPNGVDYLKAIARGIVFNVECDYSTDVEYNKEEMVADYKEILELSQEIDKLANA